MRIKCCQEQNAAVYQFGIVGLIANNGHLSTPTLRGMRDLPLESFERIRVLDLHVHLVKGELGPNGMAEKNVFDILQGAPIRHPISPSSGFLERALISASGT